MHRQIQMADLQHMGGLYNQQQNYQDYSPPSVQCPITMPFEVYPSSVSSTSTGLPFSQTSVHVITQGNTPPPQSYAAPLQHPLTGAAPLNYPPQSALGGAAAPTVGASHTGYGIVQTGAVPSSSGGFPETILSTHGIHPDEANIISVYEAHLSRSLQGLDLGQSTASNFFQNYVSFSLSL